MSGAGGFPAGFRVVVATVDSPVTNYVTNELLRRLPVALVLVENRRRRGGWRRFRSEARRRGPLRAGLRLAALPYFRWRARRATRVEVERLFAGGEPRLLAGAPVAEVRSVNSQRARRHLEAAPADLLIINGTSIVRPEVIRLARRAAINLHTGIVPEFRGCTPEFWALYEGRPDGVGVSVHHLEAAIDAGDVILMERTPVGPDDDDVTLRCRNAVLGARLLVEAARRLAAGDAERRPQHLDQGRYHPQRTLAQDLALRWRLWRRRARGAPAVRRDARGGQDA